MLNVPLKRDLEVSQTEPQYTLERLIEEAIQGDSAALYELCAHITKSVYFHVTLLVGNTADAEDVLQDALLRVCESIKELREVRAFRGWVSRITANAAQEYFKKNARRGTVVSIEDYLETILEDDEDFLPQEYAENEEHRREIVDIINTLPRRQREAVFLCYYGGLRVTEAAEQMGIEKQNVSQYLALAREKIKLELEKRQFKHGERRFLAMVPTGAVLGSVLSQGVGSTVLDMAVAQRVLASCEAAIQAKTVAEAAPPVAGAVSKLWLKPVASVAAAAITLVGVVVAINRNVPPDALPPSPPAVASVAAPQPAPQANLAGEVVFSGGENRGGGYAYSNPTGASLQAQSANGALTVLEWYITPRGDETAVLSRGEGGNVGDALSAFRQNTGSGVYMLYFTLEDAAGFNYTLGRTFENTAV